MRLAVLDERGPCRGGRGRPLADFANRHPCARSKTLQDNQKLFASSFDALKAGEAIAVFPEGGS